MLLEDEFLMRATRSTFDLKARGGQALKGIFFGVS
ncbi:hypothetical protein Rleg4DRAFT_1810 [Rhizobium leguminosarum bv. trifolii WSM2297]|uniref:Uncharacterized protein n=1 Tax=Rhizobium leguminosarum bv. trifolii WSM2297 TaxID=754762 RepID=J0KRS1_RHILT|nr:hypothetical protein Rleg4DRAFT_1810 [Rhizobium leguminosarum bv. trifolii WSM2297]